MKNYSITLLGFIISALLYALILILGVDVFEYMYELLLSFEHYELDELIFAFFIFSLFAVYDLIHRHRQRDVNEEKLRIYHAMLRSSEHVLNNFLNQMQLFKMSADKTPGFPKETLKLYEQIIAEAENKIEALGNISEIDEGDIWKSVTSDKKNQ